MKSLDQIVSEAVEKRASDIHIVCGVPVKIRVDGSLVSLDDCVLTHEDCEELGKEMCGDEFDMIRKRGELDLAKTFGGQRVRLNVFRAKGSISAALRVLTNKIPELDTLGLPPVVKDFSSYNKGIILVTGETGSGKSTTLASILNEINHTKPIHIITLEDPVEYIYENDKAVINQREVGTDTESYSLGLRAILREDPNVILIGEMRDAITIETALTAAETGHLVFATLHTNSAADSIDRIVGTFPAEKHGQVRMQLSSTLRAVLSQQLVVKKGGIGRILACECMIVNPAIRNQIKEGNTNQIQSSLLTSANLGSITMDNCLLKLVKEGKIDANTAFNAAASPEYISKSLGLRIPSSF